MSTYTSILSACGTVRDALVTLAGSASGVVNTAVDYDKFISYMAGAVPAVCVLFNSVDLSGVREMNQPKAVYDVIVKVRGDTETDIITTLSNVMAKLEDYTLGGKVAGVEIAGVDVYGDTSGTPSMIYGVINLTCLLK